MSEWGNPSSRVCLTARRLADKVPEGGFLRCHLRLGIHTMEYTSIMDFDGEHFHQWVRTLSGDTSTTKGFLTARRLIEMEP